MFSNSDGVRTISFVGDGEPIDSYLFHDSGTVQSRRVRLDWEPRHHSNFGATFQSQAWSVDGTCRQVSTQFSFPESSTQDHPNGRYSVSASGVVDVAFGDLDSLLLQFVHHQQFVDDAFQHITAETTHRFFRELLSRNGAPVNGGQGWDSFGRRLRSILLKRQCARRRTATQCDSNRRQRQNVQRVD